MINLKKHNLGMTLVEMSAVIVVVSVISLGMTLGLRGVLLHYQSDYVRQEIRYYGNSILRDIVKELSLAQRVDLDAANGFSRLKLYKFYNSTNPEMVITCNENEGVFFNYIAPHDQSLRLPNYGAYRDNGQRDVRIKDFIVTTQSEASPGLTSFKESFLNVELILSLDQDVFVNEQSTTEDHYFKRGVFLGQSFIMKKLTNDG